MKTKKKSRRKQFGSLGMNRHHWTNKSQGGKSNKQNVSWLKIKRHTAWHDLFGNLSLEEAIELLIRIKQIKGG